MARPFDFGSLVTSLLGISTVDELLSRAHSNLKHCRSGHNAIMMLHTYVLIH